MDAEYTFQRITELYLVKKAAFSAKDRLAKATVWGLRRQLKHLKHRDRSSISSTPVKSESECFMIMTPSHNPSARVTETGEFRGLLASQPTYMGSSVPGRDHFKVHDSIWGMTSEVFLSLPHICIHTCDCTMHKRARAYTSSRGHEHTGTHGHKEQLYLKGTKKQSS